MIFKDSVTVGDIRLKRERSWGHKGHSVSSLPACNYAMCIHRWTSTFVCYKPQIEQLICSVYTWNWKWQNAGGALAVTKGLMGKFHQHFVW